MSDQLPPIDHDILITLVADVKNMGKNQETFHKEMKDSLTELKTNFATRLDTAEKFINGADKAFVGKEEQEKLNDNLFKRVARLENRQIYYLGAGAVIAVIIYAIWQIALIYLNNKVH